MRVTANITSDNSLYNIQQGRARLDKISELTSSGNNINRPSDDPINTRMLLDVGDKVKAIEQYNSNISKATIWQNMTNTALTGMSDTMRITKQIIYSVSSGSSDPTILQNVVSQLQVLKQQMVDMGNTQLGDQFLFGGANNATKPFSGTAPYYSGDETALNVEITNGSSLQMNIPGNYLLTADPTAIPPQPYGGANILKAFDDLILAVQNNDVAGIQAGTKVIEAGVKQINNAVSAVSSNLTRLDSMSKLNQNNNNTLQNIYSGVQNVDYAKMAVEMSQQQTAFSASLSATAKISQLSLLDYL